MSLLRVQKYLADQGICSRREAEAFIQLGLVSLNGKTIREMGVKIDPLVDKVVLKKGAISGLHHKKSVVINKPRGIVSSRIKEEGRTIYDLFPEYLELNIVGRLDKESEGLLLLSSDGVLAKAITGDKHLTEKEYEVSVREKIQRTRMEREFKKGIKLEDGMTLPAEVRFINDHLFRIVLREGRKHQIRRMCAALNLTILKLKRIRIGSVVLGNLKSGEARELLTSEVNDLKNIA